MTPALSTFRRSARWGLLASPWTPRPAFCTMTLPPVLANAALASYQARVIDEADYSASLLALPPALSLDLAALFACLGEHPQLTSFPEWRLLYVPALWLRALLQASECFRPLLPNPMSSHTFSQEVVTLRLTRATDKCKYPQSPFNGCAIRLPIPVLAWVTAWHSLGGQIRDGPRRTFTTKAIPRSFPVDRGIRDVLVRALSETCAADALSGEHALRFAQLPMDFAATAKISFRLWPAGRQVSAFASLDPAMPARGLLARFAAMARLLDAGLCTRDLAHLWCPGIPFTLALLPGPRAYVSQDLVQQYRRGFPIRDPQQRGESVRPPWQPHAKRRKILDTEGLRSPPFASTLVIRVGGPPPRDRTEVDLRPSDHAAMSEPQPPSADAGSQPSSSAEHRQP